MTTLSQTTESLSQQQQQQQSTASPRPQTIPNTVATPPTTTASAASASPTNGEDQTKEIAPFLRSLRRMLDRESDAILCWTPDGRAFEIHDMDVMTSYILPKYFKHAKYTSFQRQLNYFNFRKWTKSRAVVCTFSNAFFVRDQPDLTWRITRKRGLSDAKSAAAAALAITDGSTPSPRASPKSPRPRAASATPSSTVTTSSSKQPVALKRELSGSKRKAPTAAAATAARKAAKTASVKTEPVVRAAEVTGVESLEWVDTLYPSLETLEAECNVTPSPLSSPSLSLSDMSEPSSSSLAPAPINVGYSYGVSSGLGSADSSDAYSNYGGSTYSEHLAYAWPQYSPTVDDADRFRTAATYFAPTVVQTSCVAL